MKLPIDFLGKMSGLMEEGEYNEFLASFDMPRYYGLRANTLKCNIDQFKEISPYSLETVPWTKDGFYYPAGENPGRHPYYYAGLYYIQEPSAMLPGAIIDAQPGENVLDLCAAPGGKTVQVAAAMKGEGILVANDINSDRVKALVKNIELMGIRNAVVTNDTPERLAVNFAGFFDKILIDAPCSGEGMFRKDEDAVKSWEKFKCEKCVCMQREILESADRMLKVGGMMVYSTCTFSPEEDERMIAEFLEKRKNYEIVEIPKIVGIECGRPHWADGNQELSKTARLWPHKVKGEGHFAALLRKVYEDGQNQGLQPEIKSENKKYGNKNSSNKNDRDKDTVLDQQDIIKSFEMFEDENLNLKIQGNFNTKGENLYSLPAKLPDLSGIKVAKFGWYLGSYSGRKFEPSHSLIVSLKKEDVKKTIDFDSKSREVLSYLKGETIMMDGDKGFTGVCVDGFTLGWAKQSGGILKNLYPKGWRKMN